MRGKLSAMILCTLKSENLYGLQIIKEIKTLTNGQTDIKLPSLYSALHKLEAEGYITSYWENSEIGGKRRYSALTEKGRQYLVEHPLDLSQYENAPNKTVGNSPSSLAIQPDFFNTIAHSERVARKEKEEERESKIIEKDIPNYSILDYISSEKVDAVNAVLGSPANEPSFDCQNPDNSDSLNLPKQDIDRKFNSTPTNLNSSGTDFQNSSELATQTYQRVYDKNDAVLLSDDEIIPHDESLSLLYRPTTIKNNEVKNEDIDYDSIFGDMIEKDVAKTTLFGTPNDNIDNDNDIANEIKCKKIDIFDRTSLTENQYTNDFAEVVPNEEKQKINILESHTNDFSTSAMAKKTLFSDNDSYGVKQQITSQNLMQQTKAVPTKETQGQPQPFVTKKNINEYLMKDKIVVEDKYKANIFLKKSNFSNSEYDFFSSPPKYNKDTLKEIERPQHKKIDIFFSNDFGKNENINGHEQSVKTLDEFVLDCEENGIEIAVYNSSCKSRVKSNNVHANRTNLLTSIITFGVLTALLLTLFFVYKTPETLNHLAIMVLVIFATSILYPIVCAVFLIKNDKIGIPVCNIKKEWIPRSIIVISIILLTLAINIINGMNTNNFSKYSPYMVIPIASSLMIIFDYFVKAAMFKVKLFREEI